MIVKPAVNELLEYAENRFALVIATSKRARQISDGDEKLTNVNERSSVTIAANEIGEGKIKIFRNENKKETEVEKENNAE